MKLSFTLISGLALATAYEHDSFESWKSAVAKVKAKAQATDTTSNSLGMGGSIEAWAPAGPNDERGPCPMLNTLANHGFLPRDGTNITLANAVHAMEAGLGFDPVTAEAFWGHGNTINTIPNSTFFTLNQLNEPDRLEHDASLSREDAYFGNNHVFNQTIFNLAKEFWASETLTANDLAMAKLIRQVQSKATNPTYTFDAFTEGVSQGELAGPILVFGDRLAGTVSRAMVEFWFENERLPSSLGWTKQTVPITGSMINDASLLIANAAILTTGLNTTVSARSLRRGSHGF